MKLTELRDSRQRELAVQNRLASDKTFFDMIMSFNHVNYADAFLFIRDCPDDYDEDSLVQYVFYKSMAAELLGHLRYKYDGKLWETIVDVDDGNKSIAQYAVSLASIDYLAKPGSLWFNADVSELDPAKGSPTKKLFNKVHIYAMELGTQEMRDILWEKDVLKWPIMIEVQEGIGDVEYRQTCPLKLFTPKWLTKFFENAIQSCDKK